MSGSALFPFLNEVVFISCMLHLFSDLDIQSVFALAISCQNQYSLASR